MNIPKTTLDQWRALQAVVDHGGYAQAAEHLYRSQSTISYAIRKLQRQLGVQLLVVEGRKARLTEAGDALIRRARQCLQEVADLEQLAQSLSVGREAEIRLVVEAAFPNNLLLHALKAFAPLSGGTRVQLKEVVLSGADEALASGEADLVISAFNPPEYLGDVIYQAEFVAVAHPGHHLHRLGRELSMSDLEREVHVVIRDSGARHSVDVGWLGAEHRWTVTSIDTALAAVVAGLGFSWLPYDKIGEHLEDGSLAILPLQEGRSYKSNLYMFFGKPNNVGPATRELAAIIRRCTSAHSAGPAHTVS